MEFCATFGDVVRNISPLPTLYFATVDEGCQCDMLEKMACALSSCQTCALSSCQKIQRAEKKPEDEKKWPHKNWSFSPDLAVHTGGGIPFVDLPYGYGFVGGCFLLAATAMVQFCWRPVCLSKGGA